MRLILSALGAHKLRSFLTLLGIAVGICAVILLTALGEGLHQFVLNEFTQFGTQVIEINPGRKDARGGPPGIPSTARELTLDDTLALEKLPDVTALTPIASGNAEVSAQGRVRRVSINGVSHGMEQVYAMKTSVGQFLPNEDLKQARAFVVLGSKVKTELFGDKNALGETLRIGTERYRIIGIMAAKGQFLGIDLDDAVYIPAARAQSLFNQSGLLKIALSYRADAKGAEVANQAKKLLTQRHGREDFNILTQDDMLQSLSRILNILTAAVAALGGISLFVGAVGIVAIMTIAVSERTAEIGLLVALGTSQRAILGLFLAEATVLAALGGLLGLTLGCALALLAGLHPSLPISIPWSYVIGAEISAILIGLIAGVLPAKNAAQLNPVDALRTE